MEKLSHLAPVSGSIRERGQDQEQQQQAPTSSSSSSSSSKQITADSSQPGYDLINIKRIRPHEFHHKNNNRHHDHDDELKLSSSDPSVKFHSPIPTYNHETRKELSFILQYQKQMLLFGLTGQDDDDDQKLFTMNSKRSINNTRIPVVNNNNNSTSSFCERGSVRQSTHSSYHLQRNNNNSNNNNSSHQHEVEDEPKEVRMTVDPRKNLVSQNTSNNNRNETRAKSEEIDASSPQAQGENHDSKTLTSNRRQGSLAMAMEHVHAKQQEERLSALFKQKNSSLMTTSSKSSHHQLLQPITFTSSSLASASTNNNTNNNYDQQTTNHQNSQLHHRIGSMNTFPFVSQLTNDDREDDNNNTNKSETKISHHQPPGAGRERYSEFEAPSNKHSSASNNYNNNNNFGQFSMLSDFSQTSEASSSNVFNRESRFSNLTNNNNTSRLPSTFEIAGQEQQAIDSNNNNNHNENLPRSNLQNPTAPQHTTTTTTQIVKTAVNNTNNHQNPTRVTKELFALGGSRNTTSFGNVTGSTATASSTGGNNGGLSSSAANNNRYRQIIKSTPENQPSSEVLSKLSTHSSSSSTPLNTNTMMMIDVDEKKTAHMIESNFAELPSSTVLDTSPLSQHISSPAVVPGQILDLSSSSSASSSNQQQNHHHNPPQKPASSTSLKIKIEKKVHTPPHQSSSTTARLLHDDDILESDIFLGTLENVPGKVLVHRLRFSRSSVMMSSSARTSSSLSSLEFAASSPTAQLHQIMLMTKRSESIRAFLGLNASGSGKFLGVLGFAFTDAVITVVETAASFLTPMSEIVNNNLLSSPSSVAETSSSSSPTISRKIVSLGLLSIVVNILRRLVENRLSHGNLNLSNIFVGSSDAGPTSTSTSTTALQERTGTFSSSSAQFVQQQQQQHLTVVPARWQYMIDHRMFSKGSDKGVHAVFSNLTMTVRNNNSNNLSEEEKLKSVTLLSDTVEILSECMSLFGNRFLPEDIKSILNNFVSEMKNKSSITAINLSILLSNISRKLNEDRDCHGNAEGAMMLAVCRSQWNSNNDERSNVASVTNNNGAYDWNSRSDAVSNNKNSSSSGRNYQLPPPGR